MSTSKAKFISIPLLVWVLSVGAAEIVFRLLGETPTNELAGLYEQFGMTYKYRPYVKTDANWVSGRFTVLTDSKGLRCGKNDVRRAPNSRRDVIVIGDSQTFGQGLSYEDTIVGRLATDAGQTATIRNVAVGGHFLEEQFNLVKWLYDDGMRPKSAVIFLTPYLIYNADKHRDVRVGPDGRVYSGDGPWYRPATMWLKTHTVIYAEVRNAFRRFIPDESPEAVSFYSVQKASDEEARLTKSMRNLQEWAANRQLSLVIIYTPLAVELDFSAVEQLAASEHRAVDRDIPFRVASTVARKLNIEFFDLRPTLAERRSRQLPLGLYKDPHYNADTSRVAADAVWSMIEHRGILNRQ